jgi:hypothetical protein
MGANNADFASGSGNVFVNAKNGDIIHLSAREILKHAVVGDMYSLGEHLSSREEQRPLLNRFLSGKVREATTGKSRSTKEENEQWARYGMQGWGGGLHQSISEKGYDETKPIEVAYEKNNDYWKEPYIYDGNHRLAVMHSLAPDTKIPVKVRHFD